MIIIDQDVKLFRVREVFTSCKSQLAKLLSKIKTGIVLTYDGQPLDVALELKPDVELHISVRLYLSTNTM